MYLKEMIEKLNNDQYIDVCSGFDENCTLKTPKTVFYGKAIECFAKRRSLWDYLRMPVEEISAYLDTIDDKTSRTVVMIQLKEG